MWALRSLGVRQVIAPCAVGSLTPDYGPGTLAVPDQLADRTSGRDQTYYDEGAAIHVSFADPYCPTGRRTALESARAWDPVDRGTLVVIEGPRFSTRAESQWFASQGWTLIGMTGHPEAVLARELALCYTSLCLVTDLDAGIEEGEGVTMQEVLRVFGQNIDRLRDPRRRRRRGAAHRTHLPLPRRPGRHEAPWNCRDPTLNPPAAAPGIPVRRGRRLRPCWPCAPARPRPSASWPPPATSPPTRP